MNKKRKIVSKGDGKNYLGFAPDGTIHNMRKSKGGFYKVKFNVYHGVIPYGEALASDQFILHE